MNHSSNSLLTIFARISLGALLSTFLCWQPRVKAQMSISPMIIEAEAQRGRAQGTIDVGNQSDQPIRARIYAEPFTYNDQGFQTVKSEVGDLTPYLQFSPKELIIPPGKTRKIRLSTLFSPNLPEGEYRAAIFAERLQKSPANIGNNNNNNESVVNTTFKIRIAATLFVHQGKLNPNLAVKEASWNSEQKKIQILVSNVGKASVYPSGNWILKQGETEVAKGNLPKTGIVAETERHFFLNYPQKDGIAPGEFQLTGELLWGDSSNSEKVPFDVNVTIPAPQN